MIDLFENKSLDLKNFGADNHIYLSTIEVQNWGPFSGFWEIPLKTLPALVVGENGTGKSSLMDGILTVLVEHGLQYNNAVDNKGRVKGRRKLEEYVRGFKESNKDGNSYKNVLYLREKGEISFVLLRFCSFNHTYTVGQIFAVNEGDTASKKYFYKDGFLTARDFPKNASTLDEYCALLNKIDNVVANADRKKYFSFVREKLALDTNAMHLLNMLSSRKDIDDVNVMIRNYMFLDKSDFTNDFNSLRIELDNINVFINKLKELKERNNFLKDIIVPKINAVREIQRRMILMKSCKDKIVPFLYRCAKNIGLAESEELKDKINALVKIRDNLNKQQEEALVSKATLEVAKNNIGGMNITSLELEIKALEADKRNKQLVLQTYNDIIKKLGLSVDNSNNNSFLKGKKLIKDEEAKLDSLLTENTIKKEKLLKEHSELTDKIHGLVSQKRELERNKISLPANLVALRNELCEIAKIPASDMPFLGEYLSVNDKEWIPALEYLFHDASLSFLVPVKFEKLVHSHIDGLKKKYRTGANYAVMNTVNYRETKDAAWEKITVRQDLKYVSWVEEYVKKIGYPQCCDTVEEFIKSPSAIMKNGLRSLDRIRHKMDGRKFDDVHNYVMSGSYQQLLDTLTIDIETALNQKKDVDKAIVENKNSFDLLAGKKSLFTSIPAISDFNAIDISDLDIQISEKIERLTMLKRSRDFTDIEKNIAKIENKINKIKDSLNKNEEDYIALNKNLSILEDKIKTFEEKLIATSFSDEEENLLKVEYDKRKPASANPKFNTIMELRTNIESHFYKQMSKDNEDMVLKRQSAETYMDEYIKKYKSRINDLRASMDYEAKHAEKFIEEYERIKDDYLEKANELSEKIGKISSNSAINSFIIGLTHNVDETIKDIINNINETLKRVPYSNDKNPTFLEVSCVQTKNAAVVELRKRLNEVAGFLNNEEKFEELALRVNDLIHFINNFNIKYSEKYNKDNILDIRNWFEFPVAECRWNDAHTELYHIKELDEIGKQSGGEGVKLAYFIMAACYSMWMHFNDSNYNKNVFGFLMIDEIDGKISPANLHDVIMLFFILGIQLVSMLPISDKVSQYENFVGNIVCTGYLQKPESYIETLSYADYINRNKKLIDEKIKRGKEAYEQSKAS